MMINLRLTFLHLSETREVVPPAEDRLGGKGGGRVIAGAPVSRYDTLGEGGAVRSATSRTTRAFLAQWGTVKTHVRTVPTYTVRTRTSKQALGSPVPPHLTHSEVKRRLWGKEAVGGSIDRTECVFIFVGRFSVISLRPALGPALWARFGLCRWSVCLWSWGSW